MTISSTTVKNSYSGNGTLDTFNYTFKIFANTDLQVIIRDATATETVKTLTTHYTVTGAGSASGGTIVFTAGNIPSATETVVIRRAVPQTQAIDYIANDPFPAESHEEGLDRAMMTLQQLQEEVDRSIKLSRTNTMNSTEFTIGDTERVNKVFGFDSAGELVVTQELGTFRGNWSTSTAFAVRDIIKDTSNNNVYICLTAHTSSGTQPISTNTDVAKWSLLVDAASATSSASAAASSASAASTSASNAATSETNAATSAGNASTSASNASASATAAANSYDSFDDRYLGAKATDPTLDNDSNALIDGALYFDTTLNVMKVYDLGTTSWKRTTPTTSEQTNIDAVTTNEANINTVSTNIASVNTVATNIADVIAVANDLTEAVSEVETVANDLNEAVSEIDTVATNIANVNTVGTNIANVNTVAGISGNVTTVAGISGNVTSVAGNATNINTVAGNNANISTVAGISGNVTTVAGISADVTAVAGDATDIGTVATNLTGTNTIGTVAGSIANVNNVGGSIANVNTVATNLASVNNFGEVYRISATAPITSLNSGDLYFDTSTNILNVYGASGWQNAGSSVNGTSQRYNYTATSGQTTFTGADNNGNTLTYDAGYIDVYLNGVKLLNGTDVTVTSGSSVVLASGATTGDVVDIVAYGTFSVASLNADNLDSGTVPSARISGAYTGITNLTMSGDLTVDTNTLFVDASENTVVVGGTDASSWDTNADELVVAGASAGGMTFYNPTQTNIFFADGTIGNEVSRGRIQYIHSDDSLRFGTSGNNANVYINNAGKLGLSTSTPEGRLHIYDFSGSGGFRISRTNDILGSNFHITCGNDDTFLSTYGNLRFRTEPLGDGVGGTDRLYISDAGDIGIGTITPSQKLDVVGSIEVSDGIYIGGTAAANKLDDYEEGTWTPTVNSATGFSTGVTNNFSMSKYTKIGNTVWVKCRFQLGNSSGNVTAGDNITVTGLPFTPASQDHAINCHYRYNENNAIVTVTTAESANLFCQINYVRGTALRNGGVVSINFNYIV